MLTLLKLIGSCIYMANRANRANIWEIHQHTQKKYNFRKIELLTNGPRQKLNLQSIDVGKIVWGDSCFFFIRISRPPNIVQNMSETCPKHIQNISKMCPRHFPNLSKTLPTHYQHMTKTLPTHDQHITNTCKILNK